MEGGAATQERRGDAHVSWSAPVLGLDAMMVTHASNTCCTVTSSVKRMMRELGEKPGGNVTRSNMALSRAALVPSWAACQGQRCHHR